MPETPAVSERRVVVTGAGGFVGRALLERLTQEPGIIPVGWHRTLPHEDGADGIERVATGALEDAFDLAERLEGVDCVVHLAGRAHRLTKAEALDEEAFRQANEVATEHIALAAREAGVRRVVFVSSIATIGKVVDGDPICDTSISSPTTPYGRSKLAGERALARALDGSDTQWTILRPPLVFSREAAGNLGRLARLAGLGVPLPLTARNRRTLISLPNLVDALVTAIDHPDVAGATHVVADPEPVSTAQITRAIADPRRVRTVEFAAGPARFLLRAARMSGIADQLFGSLEVDGSGFREATGWKAPVGPLVSAPSSVAKVDAPRVLFVSQYFDPEGVSNNKVVEALVSRGYAVDVWTAVPNYPEGRFFEGYGLFQRNAEIVRGARVRRLPVVPRGQSGIARLGLNAASFALSGSLRALFLRRGKYDVVFSSLLSPGSMGFPAAVAAWRMKVPHAQWVQDLWPQTAIQMLDIRQPLIVRAMTAAFDAMYARVSLFLLQSLAYRAALRLESRGTPWIFFPNTIESFHTPFPDASARKEAAGYAPEDCVLVYAGNMGTGQSIDTIIDAIVLADDARLKILMLGDGRDRERAQRRIDQLGLTSSFRFEGSVPAPIVAEHLSYADAALLTLREEPALAPTVPYRMQAYLGCGTPILASIAGEPARIISQFELGFVSAPGDADGLADSMKRIVDLDENERSRMSARARGYAVANYDAQTVYDRLDMALRALARRDAGSLRALASDERPPNPQ